MVIQDDQLIGSIANTHLNKCLQNLVNYFIVLMTQAISVDLQELCYSHNQVCGLKKNNDNYYYILILIIAHLAVLENINKVLCEH